MQRCEGESAKAKEQQLYRSLAFESLRVAIASSFLCLQNFTCFASSPKGRNAKLRVVQMEQPQDTANRQQIGRHLLSFAEDPLLRYCHTFPQSFHRIINQCLPGDHSKADQYFKSLSRRRKTSVFKSVVYPFKYIKTPSTFHCICWKLTVK